MIKDKQPNKVPAHWTPRLLNICRANRGKHPPITDRRIVFAAKTDAVLLMGIIRVAMYHTRTGNRALTIGGKSR